MTASPPKINLSLCRPALAALLSLTCASPAGAQDTATAAADETEKKEILVIDEDPIASPRAAGMGGAITTVADDLDAAFHNPAGIGGLGDGKKKNANWVRKLYFPWIVAGANKSSKELYDEMQASGGNKDRTVGQAVVAAHAGERQYGRANGGFGLVLGRTMVVPFADAQMASTAREDGLMDTRYRSMSGLGFGFSAQDPSKRFALGYFGYTATRSEVEAPFSYDQMIEIDKRAEALKQNTVKYSGTGHNAGFIWRLSNKTAKPAFGVNVKNAGNTTFNVTDKGETEKEVEPIIIKQDTTAAMSISPSVGKNGVANVVLAVAHLNPDDNTSFSKKVRFGAEYLFGGAGSYSLFGVRAGANGAGPSAGLSIHLGLIGIEASVYSVDVGAGNRREIEQRGLATVYVNVADF